MLAKACSRLGREKGKTEEKTPLRQGLGFRDGSFGEDLRREKVMVRVSIEKKRKQRRKRLRRPTVAKRNKREERGKTRAHVELI